MITRSNFLLRLITLSLFGLLFAAPSLAQGNKPASEAEVKAFSEIKSAADVPAKLTLAEAFSKKYSKSTLRVEVVKALVGDISGVADEAQRLSYAERLQKSFSGPAEVEVVRPLILDGYIRAKRLDDAFNLGGSILAKQPENVEILAALATAGTEAARKQNTKHASSSLQYGLKAIELIEANKKPTNMDEANWTYQKSLLPQLYLDMGALALANGKGAEAKPRLEKAIQMNPTEPSAYALLGGVIDDEYRTVAESYQSMPEGPQRQETLKKATALMDQVIDLYAHALGAASGKAQYKAMYDQVLESVTPYYRYRYKSTSGLPALIEKYKTPATP